MEADAGQMAKELLGNVPGGPKFIQILSDWGEVRKNVLSWAQSGVHTDSHATQA
jgi:hypothetical protein